MELVRDPSQFEVIVTGNLFGDVLSDLSAALVGGMGVAPSANINPDTGRGLFEPIHGSAPNMAGKGVVNPIGAILTAGLLADHLGDTEAAGAIEQAVGDTIRAGDTTPTSEARFPPRKSAPRSAAASPESAPFSPARGVPGRRRSRHAPGG